jgi:cytochrome P450
MASVIEPATCPVHANRDDRKTAAVAAERGRPEAGTKPVRSFKTIRDVLRSPAMKQAGGGAEYFDLSDPEKAPVFFLDGPVHKKKRATIARYFTPRAITTRYNLIVEKVIAEQFAEFRMEGRGRLDLMSFDLAVAVAGDIVGLTVSDRKKMAKRLAFSLSAAFYPKNPVARLWVSAKKMIVSIDFFYNDVRPAIRDRTANPREDLLSHLIKEGYSSKAMLMECMTYGAAGMVTTREFIVMSAWHMFDNAELREQFLAADQDAQFAILLEILRLEPIAAFLYRKAEGEPGIEGTEDGNTYALCLRDANTEEATVGACPHMIDPDRAANMKANGSFMSFGDGAHHCPGWQVALHETRMFLDALFRVPGIKLDRAPDIGWSTMLQSYELRNAIVTCDRA